MKNAERRSSRVKAGRRLPANVDMVVAMPWMQPAFRAQPSRRATRWLDGTRVRGARGRVHDSPYVAPVE
jgi:hypothetical protein